MPTYISLVNYTEQGIKSIKDSPKQRLLAWVQGKIPECGITNFTKDWNDGRALGALVDAVHPGLNPDWRGWHPDDALGNAQTAMDLADQNLGVAKLMQPEEMINPRVDEQSVMTYLSQYPSARFAPRKPRTPTPPPRRTARLSGPGLRGPLPLGKPTQLLLSPDDGQPGRLELRVTGPDGRSLPVQERFQPTDGAYHLSFTPVSPGLHRVSRLLLFPLPSQSLCSAGRVSPPPPKCRGGVLLTGEER